MQNNNNKNNTKKGPGSLRYTFKLYSSQKGFAAWPVRGQVMLMTQGLGAQSHQRPRRAREEVWGNGPV